MAVPFSPAHRQHVQTLISERTQIARQFTYAGAIIGISGLVGLFPSALEEGVAVAVAMSVGLTILVAAMLWWFGWRRVFMMKQDLAEGQLDTVSGKLERLDRIKNAYGETITHATLAGTRHTTREPLFDGFDKGEVLTIDRLPRSKVPLAVRHADQGL